MTSRRPSLIRRIARKLRRSDDRVGPAGTAGDKGAADRPAAWYANEWARLAAAITDGEVTGPPADPAAARTTAKTARLRAGESLLAGSLARGADLPTAVRETVVHLAGHGKWMHAWSISESLGRTPGCETAGRVGKALVHHHRRQFARSWALVRSLTDADLALWLPVEAVDGSLAEGPHRDPRRASSIAAAYAGADPGITVDLAGRLLAHGEPEAAAALMATLEAEGEMILDPRRAQVADLIRRWLVAEPPTIPPGSVPIGILDYRMLYTVKASRNLGDYVQTLALLGTLAAMSDVQFSGEDELGETATGLQARVRSDLRRPGIAGRVHLLPIARDFSTGDAVPSGTWMIAFGWHMHPLHELSYDFPYHPNIRPIFVAFHVNRLEMLDEQALDYLREHGPVGCRDWTTVFLLLGYGVDAFFTGCLTSTIDAVFPSREQVYSGAQTVGWIDMPEVRPAARPKGVRVYTHETDENRLMSMADAIRAADQRLAEYQRDLARAETERLHAFVPLASLGVPATLHHPFPGDMRFAGLAQLRTGEPALDVMRNGLRDLIVGIAGPIVTGADEATVYATWRAMTADRVAEARQLFEAEAKPPEPAIDVLSVATAAIAASRQQEAAPTGATPGAVDVAIRLTGDELLPAAVLLTSIAARSSAPVRAHLVTRGVGEAQRRWLARAADDIALDFIPLDGAGGPGGGTDGDAGIDLLLLPQLLPDLDRVVCIDPASIVLADIRDLADIDLGDAPLAARETTTKEPRAWQLAVKAAPTDVAQEFRRQMALLHGSRCMALDAGVLVLDLGRMRRDAIAERCLAYAAKLGLDASDAILAGLGPDRSALDARWNAIASTDETEGAFLVRWGEFAPPWGTEVTVEQMRWRTIADSVLRLAGEPPAA